MQLLHSYNRIFSPTMALFRLSLGSKECNEPQLPRSDPVSYTHLDTHSEKQQQTVIGTKVGGEDEKGAFANRLNFETYNLGHLMMAGIIPVSYTHL